MGGMMPILKECYVTDDAVYLSYLRKCYLDAKKASIYILRFKIMIEVIKKEYYNKISKPIGEIFPLFKNEVDITKNLMIQYVKGCRGERERKINKLKTLGWEKYQRSKESELYFKKICTKWLVNKRASEKE